MKFKDEDGNILTFRNWEHFGKYWMKFLKLKHINNGNTFREETKK